MAHAPLANIILPASAENSFDTMIDVVSFDYFPLTDVINFGFTPTEPWSSSFEYLGYETVNFIEGMGSILLCMWIGLVYILIVALLVCCRAKVGNNRCRGCLTPFTAFSTAIGFMLGTFFEVLVCLSVSMSMFEIWEFLNASDKFSIANQLVVVIPVVAVTLYGAFFALFRAPKLVALRKFEKLEKNKENLDSIRQNFKQTVKEKAANIENPKRRKVSMLKIASAEANSFIDKRQKKKDKLKATAKGWK